ncbi:tRNA:m(4)X modification enzyme TRM13 homolog [Durio zibethinus]|uniref:tRNA:m(4)X modification enzyme TRM13 n=1 Tax=Durio zibethinus TaxID=66656 RepID=A0A6P5ZYC3_DURZI|nr:tRNA:m(4)X modification enzyme TRM13 homolog [Durio zibethinus]
MENRCKFWLPKKNRFCANAPLNNSLFCGNHTPRKNDQWIPCPIDPSHSVLQENLEGHLKRCPLLKQVQSLSTQPFYQKGINAGKEDEQEEQETLIPTSGSFDNVTSEMKRNAVYNLNIPEFFELIRKMESVHAQICKDIKDSFKIPEACGMWMKREVDRKLPFQEKHVTQQASILGNLEEFGVLENSVGKEHCEFGELAQSSNVFPAVVEFGAGRGYLTQMLADCYGIRRVFLVERKSYKLKADRSLRQKESLILERLRIDIEDLNLNAVQPLQGLPYIAIGKHLCGTATDLTLRCCLANQRNVERCGGNCYLRGLAIATCCHHLCQWKHYINKKYLTRLGITKEEFHAMTWFTSWAVDADHGSDLSDVSDFKLHPESIEKEECTGDANRVESIARNMKAIDRAKLGFMCKQIIDMGRLMWVKEHGLETQLVKYVPSTISPENHLLVARNVIHF